MLSYCFPFASRLILGLLALGVFGLAANPAAAQMKTGEAMQAFEEVFDVELSQRGYPFEANLVECDVPGKILWPGEQPRLTFAIRNNLDRVINTQGRIHVIRYGTKGIAGNIWLPELVRFEDVAGKSIEVDLEAGETTRIDYHPELPGTFGGYAFIVELAGHGRRVAATLARSVQVETEPQQYPAFSLDIKDPTILRRLGVQAIRMGSSYIRSDRDDYEQEMAALGERLKKLHEANVTVMLMPGASPAPQPLGQSRPHLTEEGIMKKGKKDRAWLPSYDDDFADWCYEVSRRWGWPKGPVTSFSLWNEPWEGLSISGWGADMIRFRSLYKAMAEGVRRARAEHGVEVLATGCDSGSNTIDKLFPDGSDEYLKYLDACTVHYHGLNAPSTYKQWINRSSSTGRVKIWDTESWIANTDDRIGIALAAMRSAGYDRTMGIFSGNIHNSTGAWSTAAAYAAAHHFLARRDFREILFRKGLPWVFVFDGPEGEPDEGSIVITGDIGDTFQHEQLLFRTVRSLAEIRQKADWRAQLQALPEGAGERRAELEQQLAATHARSGGRMVIDAGDSFRLYDFYGNPVDPTDGEFVIPLNHQGFFFRTDGSKGSFDRLVEAVRAAHIDGFEPLEMIPHDMLARIETKPRLRVKMTNIYNRPIEGGLTATLGDLEIEYPRRLSFEPHETKMVNLQVTGGEARADNTYPLSLRFDAADGEIAVHREDMRVNVIHHRTITVDGKLDDWRGAVAQPVVSDQSAEPTMTEAAWFPFVDFDEKVSAGVASGYLAYDEDNFYFAAKIADGTACDGTLRFETRDDDEYFYPKVSYKLKSGETLAASTRHAPRRLDEGFLPRKGPNSSEHLRIGWKAVSQAVGFDIHVPEDESWRVAIYYLHWKGQYAPRPWMQPRIVDPETGKVLLKPPCRGAGIDSYFVFEVRGDVRIEFPSNWIRGQISGLFIDAVPADQAAVTETPGAAYLGPDYETEGDWPGKYGSVAYMLPDGSKGGATDRVKLLDIKETEALKWPDGVRQYTYRKFPILPSGNYPKRDNVQIAFNVVPVGEGPRIASPPGTMPRYTGYHCTDYEYALNKVAEEYGGGTEIWRLLVPGMPTKHFYPRQPASPYDGPVQKGKLETVHEGGTRIVECAIPWSELPKVKQRLDAGQTIKFSYRVNDNGGGGLMELAAGRSVSRSNSHAFSVDWTRSWANELEFAAEKE